MKKASLMPALNLKLGESMQSAFLATQCALSVYSPGGWGAAGHAAFCREGHQADRECACPGGTRRRRGPGLPGAGRASQRAWCIHRVRERRRPSAPNCATRWRSGPTTFRTHRAGRAWSTRALSHSGLILDCGWSMASRCSRTRAAFRVWPAGMPVAQVITTITSHRSRGTWSITGRETRSCASAGNSMWDLCRRDRRRRLRHGLAGLSRTAGRLAEGPH
jgi:hypothetical protein